MKKQINTEAAPAAIGPYSQGIEIDGFIFTSGQIPIDPKTSEMVENDIEKQTVQVLKNLKNVLKKADLGMDNIIKTSIFLSDLGNFDKVNEIYEGYFGDIPPARSCVEVAKLPKNSLIEIEAVAR